MSLPLNYFPAYVGLFAAQALALACNAYLDIQYGIFTTEVVLWSLAFAYTLRVGWRQHGEASEYGTTMMRRFAIATVILTLFVFLPVWGLPRAGIYILAALQASYNCSTTTRRQLHMSLLMSLAMVIFAATHFRADWTMLFYLVPYVTAVVFTLVAEQINREADNLRQQSLGNQVIGAQSIAIAAATLVILVLGLILYTITPQNTWASLTWRYGNPTAVGVDGQAINASQGNGNQSNNASSGQSSAGKSQDSGAGAGGGRWPTPGEMRLASKRPGMPEWQRKAINGLADLTEGIGNQLKPILKKMSSLSAAIKQWIKDHKSQILSALMLMMALALLLALWKLLKEVKAVSWVISRIEYIRYGMLGMHSPGRQGAAQYYKAMERLLGLHEMERSPMTTTQEYLIQTGSILKDMRTELIELTQIFEDSRYGENWPDPQVLLRMRMLYRDLYQKIDM